MGVANDDSDTDRDSNGTDANRRTATRKICFASGVGVPRFIICDSDHPESVYPGKFVRMLLTGVAAVPRNACVECGATSVRQLLKSFANTHNSS